MNIIYINGLFPKERYDEIILNSKDIIHLGPNKLQWSFLSGLNEYFANLKVVSTPLLGNFPANFKKIYFKSSKFSYNSSEDGYCIGSIRLPFIGLLSKAINLFVFFITKCKKDNNVFFLYSGHMPYLISTVFFKIFFPNNKICLFVNDLPEYMSNNRNLIYLFFKKFEVFLFRKLLNKVDSFIVVSNYLPEILNIENKPWLLMEGVFDVNTDFQPISDNQKGKRIILYTGTLDSRYGILDLLEAFSCIDDNNCELQICGDGDMKKVVINAANMDSRIKFFGQIPHNEVLSLQINSNVLVNPRKSDGEYTKYSFPIKTLEYLASGRPCIMYKLPGIPPEYIKHIFVPDNECPTKLAEKIVEVMNMEITNVNIHCKVAYDFIKNEKSINFQFGRIHKFLLNNI